MKQSTLLVLGLGAAAFYLYSRNQAAAGGGMTAAQRAALAARNPNYWAALAQQQGPAMLNNLIYYPYNQTPAGSPTPQSGTQMAWPTSATTTSA